MTVLMPEFFQTQKYAAQRLRQQFLSTPLLGEGIVNFGDFKVAQRGAGANMSVDVAAGDAWVQGDSAARQGLYHVGNDGTVNVAVPAANATNPRIDQLILKVNDSTVVGGGDSGVLELLAGTATGGATLANRGGAAALPASALRLADILVPAASSSVVTANIGNPKNPRVGGVGQLSGSISSVAGAPALYACGHSSNYIPTVRAFRSGGQSVTTSAFIAFNFTDTWDAEAMHDTVTNNDRLVCQTPGLYAIHGQCVVGATTARLQIQAFTEAVVEKEEFAVMPQNAAAGNQQVSGIFRLDYGDFVRLQAAFTGTAEFTNARMTMTWIAP